MNKGWYLVRKGRARLKSKYPMVIQLEKRVKLDENDKSYMTCGIDDGSAHVGLAIVQKCPIKNKVVFKGTIEQRQDVKHLIDVRRGYRRYHRYHKRYRPMRFNNRSSSKRIGRLAPSIKQKKDAILRILFQLNKWTIKPMRRKSKAKINNVLGIKHRDLVSYTYKNGETHTGYVTALYSKQLALNFQSRTKHCKKVNARKCRLLWQFNKIYWLE